MNYKKNLFLFSLLLFFNITAKCTVIDDVRDEARAVFLIGITDDPGLDVAYYQDILGDLNAQGKFINNSVDYPNHNFDVEHLQKLVELTQARARKQNNPTTDLVGLDMTNLEAKIVKGLNWWYNKVDYHASQESWWWNQIGKQRELHKISVLFHDYLTDSNNDTVLELIEPGTTNPVTIYHPSAPTVGITNITAAISADYPTTLQDPDDTDDYSGANKADIAVSIVAKGLLENNQTWFDAGKEAFRCTMIFATDTNDQGFDGIREDYSFNQHNYKNKGFLYTGGYGKSHIHNVVTWGSIFENADQGFDPADKAIFFDFILEGFRRMIIGNTTDYSTSGRYITRKYPNSNTAIPAEDMLLAIEMAGGASTTIGARLQDMQAKIDAGSRQVFNNEEHKFFQKSDYVAHHGASYFTSVRMCSNRTIGTESTNGQNKLGYWLPYGCTFIYQHGNEYIRPDPNSSEPDPNEPEYYENIFPLWDWTKIPGVTCPDFMPEFNHPGERTIRSSQIDLDYGCGNTISGEDEFVGNASNGKFGVSTLLLNKDYDNDLQTNYIEDGNSWETDCDAINQVNISAKKAWFHFGDEIIALGSDINTTDNKVWSTNEYNINTTINQCLLVGTLPQVSTTTTNKKYVFHDGIAYIMSDDQTPIIGSSSQSGNWNDIDNCSQNCSASGEVFSLWIDNGNPNAADDPQYHSSYAYRIVPGATSSTAQSYDSDNPITYFNGNGTDLQWVRKDGSDENGRAGIVYYPGSNPVNVEVSTGINLRTDKPCALLYDQQAGEVCISSPNREFSSIELIINDNANSPITFTMPSGDMAGTSICRSLFAIAGNISSHCADEGIQDVDILLNISNAGALETDANGDYRVSDLLPGDNFTITPSKDINYLNGVGGEDLVLIARHILQIEALGSPYKMIAADVNNSGWITTLDMVAIKKLILFIDDEFPLVDSWRFVDADFVFPDPANPWSTVFPELITVNDLGSSEQRFDFKAIKMGDVNCSADNALIQPPCEEEINILVEDKAYRANDVFTVALLTNNFEDIAAYQFALRFDATKLEYQSLQSGDLNRGAKVENFNLSTTGSGLIRTSWLYNEGTNLSYTVIDTTLADTSSLFIVEFKALEDISALSAVMNIQTEDFPAAAWSDGEDCARNVIMEFVPDGYAGSRNSKQSDSNNLTIPPSSHTGEP